MRWVIRINADWMLTFQRRHIEWAVHNTLTRVTVISDDGAMENWQESSTALLDHQHFLGLLGLFFSPTVCRLWETLQESESHKPYPPSKLVSM